MNEGDYFIYDICNRFKCMMINDLTITKIEFEIYRELELFGIDLNKINFKIRIINDNIVMDVGDLNDYTRNIFLTPRKQLIRISKLKELI